MTTNTRKLGLAAALLAAGALLGSAATQAFSSPDLANSNLTDKQIDAMKLKMTKAYADGDRAFYTHGTQYGIRLVEGASPLMGFPMCELFAVKAQGFDLKGKPVSFAQEPTAKTGISCPAPKQ